MRKNKKKARLSSANSTGKVLNTSWKEYNDMARKVKNVENTAHKMDRGLELRVKDWGLSQCMGMENIPIEYVMSQSESVGMSDYQDSEIQTDDVIEIESTGSETNKEDDLGQIIINIDEVEETKYIYQSTLQTPLTRPLYFNLNKEEYSKLESEQSRFAYNIPAKRPRIHNNLHIYNQAIPYNKYKRANKRPERTFHSKRLSTIQPETKNYSSAKLSLSAKSDKSIALGQLYPECVDCDQSYLHIAPFRFEEKGGMIGIEGLNDHELTKFYNSEWNNGLNKKIKSVVRKRIRKLKAYEIQIEKLRKN